MTRGWISRLAGEGAFAQLADTLAPSDAWSVMMEVDPGPKRAATLDA